MPAKKIADLSSSLVAVKGKAAVVAETTPSQPAVRSQSSSNAPLNFKVDPEFRRRFRQCIAFLADSQRFLSAALGGYIDAGTRHIQGLSMGVEECLALIVDPVQGAVWPDHPEFRPVAGLLPPGAGIPRNRRRRVDCPPRPGRRRRGDPGAQRPAV